MRKWNWKFFWSCFAGALLGAVVGFCSLFSVGPCCQILEVTARSATATELHVYYDIGQGFTPHSLSVNRLPLSAEPSALCYCLPDIPIKKLRLDPGAGSNQLTIQKISLAYPDQEAFPISLSTIKPMHQIEWHRMTDNGVTFQIAAEADDPMLLIDSLPGPTSGERFKTMVRMLFSIVSGVAMVICAWALFWFVNPVYHEGHR
jgi:hypothetical protein